MTDRALFARIAPRLERAHREERERLARARAGRLRQRETVLRLERLVAHRELQLVRGYSRVTSRKKRAAYIEERQRKLDEARAALRRARQHAERIGALERRI